MLTIPGLPVPGHLAHALGLLTLLPRGAPGYARRVAPAEAISHFEFWPRWLFYLPLVAYWAGRAVRHGSITLPTAANPGIETGGLCGESKSAILDRVEGDARAAIAPYTVAVAGEALSRGAVGKLGWPLVVKPDIGCNGAGVRLVRDAAALRTALGSFPRDTLVLVQAFAPGPGEAGVFYVRAPGEACGRITSLTLKHAPSVVGDGRSTLRALVLAHKRAGQVPHLYLPRFRDRLGCVVPAGETVPLVFAGNHCKGSVFRDGAAMITPELTARIDAFARALPGFRFGRIDLRYPSDAALRAGRDLLVLEVNGVGSEATHIWDGTCSLRDAYRAQFAHHRMAWELGRAMRVRGHAPSGVRAVLRAWRRQRRLMAAYPPGD